MAEKTKIEWTDHTFNPWQGCAKVSPGCKHCYAALLTARFSNKGVIWGPKGTRVRTSDENWKLPLRWNRQAEASGTHAKVFCASMADVFEDGRDAELDPMRRELFDLVAATPHLTWQLLTKRPQAIAPTLKRLGLPADHFLKCANVWLGSTVEDAEYAAIRVRQLVEVPAAVHFLSVEPLLGPIPNLPLEDVEWVIVGGESGASPRPMEADWVRNIREQCVDRGVAFFFKQWGGRNKAVAGRELDGRTWDEFPPLARS